MSFGLYTKTPPDFSGGVFIWPTTSAREPNARSYIVPFFTSLLQYQTPATKDQTLSKIYKNVETFETEQSRCRLPIDCSI